MKPLTKHLFGYGIVGGIAFLIDFSVLRWAVQYLHWHPVTAASLGFVIGLFVNYLLCLNFVFSEQMVVNRLLEFFIFSLIGIIGLAINDLVIYIFLKKTMMEYQQVKVVATAIVFFFNFFARRSILFTRNHYGIEQCPRTICRANLPKA